MAWDVTPFYVQLMQCRRPSVHVLYQHPYGRSGFDRLLPLLFVAMLILGRPELSSAQVRGLYPPGVNAINAGTLPDPGATYMNYFQLFSFDELKAADGGTIPTSGHLSVFLDHNFFIWTSTQEILGAKFLAQADLVLSNKSLTAATIGSATGAGGLADSFFQPFSLGWSFSRADIRAGYGFIAPTGRFELNGVNNVGSGVWAHSPTSGQTIYLTSDKKTAVSAFQLYEFHTKQEDTDIRPGQTFNIDYSATRTFEARKETQLQIGAVGYGQYQTTGRQVPTVSGVITEGTRYRVNALGAAATIILPERKTSTGARYFHEFSNSSTIQGWTIQIYATITF